MIPCAPACFSVIPFEESDCTNWTMAVGFKHASRSFLVHLAGCGCSPLAVMTYVFICDMISNMINE